jgi:hypothetical protein
LALTQDFDARAARQVSVASQALAIGAEATGEYLPSQDWLHWLHSRRWLKLRRARVALLQGANRVFTLAERGRQFRARFADLIAIFNTTVTKTVPAVLGSFQSEDASVVRA